MSRAQAEREVEDLEAQAAFHLRMGCPPAVAEVPLRERLVEALAENAELREQAEDVEYLRRRLEKAECDCEEAEVALDDERRELRQAHRRIEELESELEARSA